MVVVVVVVGAELVASKVRVNVTIDDKTRSTYTFGHPETQWYLVELPVAFISSTILTRFPNIISDKSIKPPHPLQVYGEIPCAQTLIQPSCTWALAMVLG